MLHMEPSALERHSPKLTKFFCYFLFTKSRPFLLKPVRLVRRREGAENFLPADIVAID
jgi:hypothetical protein